MSSSRDNRRGILALVTASAAFTVNDAIVKFVAQNVPLGEVLFVRGLMTIALLGGALACSTHRGTLGLAFGWAVLSRSFLEAASAALFTTGLIHVALAELSAMQLCTPLIITALAVVFLDEKVGWRRWLAIGVGLLGTLLILRPAPSAFNPWALIGLASALSSASRDLITRYIDPRMSSLGVSVMTAVAVTAMGAALGLSESWLWPTPEQLAFLAVASVFIGIGNVLIVVAFRGVEVSAVVPFRYVWLLWAGLVGFVAFGEVPDAWAAAGAALIIASGLYALHRERVRHHTGTAALQPPGRT